MKRLKEVSGSEEVPHPAEAGGWFTVSRAAQLLELPLPRIFDAIRDGKLQVRFEPTKPGESDKPFVTSAELKKRATASGAPVAVAATSVLPVDSAAVVATAGSIASVSPPQPQPAAQQPPVQPPPSQQPPAINETQRAMRLLEVDLAETRTTLDEAEQQLDAALKAVYERDVRIARLEADIAAHAKIREDSDGFIRHLETRLDRTEERSDEKEKEIRRLAVGLGEARGEIRLLKPPDPEPEPPRVWRRRLSAAATLLGAAASGAVAGFFAYQLAGKSLKLEAGVAAGVGAAVAFIAGLVLDRVRKMK